MEKKTIGSFIATLRKANGMTQKDLADMLNVSDKTISRWERDEGSPDLSLIPVIAEIFNVSCDELLRGERKSPEERNNNTTEETSTKAEKQRKFILKAGISKYRNQTFISMGISLLGLIVAIICNNVFYQATLGFILGTIFFLAAAICQIIFINNALFSVSGDEFDDEQVKYFKYDIIHMAEIFFGLLLCLIVACAPLIAVGGGFLGLLASEWINVVIVGIIAALIIYFIICYFFNAALIKKEVFAPKSCTVETYFKNHKKIGKYAVILFVIVIITNVAQVILNPIFCNLIYGGVKFTDYDSFVDYMEMEVDENSCYIPDKGYIIDYNDSGYEFYDEYNEYDTENDTNYGSDILTDTDGNVVCTYTVRNYSVFDVSASLNSDGELISITADTYYHQNMRNKLSDVIKIISYVICIIEVIVTLLIYRKRRVK